MLPWQVLQELDCLKKSDNALGYRSREATRWLFDILSKRHPRLKGQPMTPKISQNPDDAILHCAIIVKEHVNVVVSSQSSLKHKLCVYKIKPKHLKKIGICPVEYYSQN